MFCKELSFSLFTIVIISLTGFSLNVVHAQSMKNDVAMITMKQKPYGFILADGSFTGVLYDILNEIIRESGVGQVNQIIPPKRLVFQLRSNKKTCSLVADSPSSVSSFDFIEPIGYELITGILPRAGLNLIDHEDLKGLTIAVPLGIDIKDTIKNDINFFIISPPQYINAIGMLHKGRVDGIAGAISTLKYIGLAEGMTTKDFGRELVFQRNYVHLVCTYAISRDTRQMLRRAVVKLKENGTIKDILKRYFNESDF